MNTPNHSDEPATHLTIRDLDRASEGCLPSHDSSMLNFSGEDCLIATHEFDTSPSDSADLRAASDSPLR